MKVPRISASSYSNTAPLVWSFLYGSRHGDVEIILDNAPARSAELLAGDGVDAALVPVIAFQTIENVKLIPGVCVGARERVRSVCLVTDGRELDDVRSVALDVSSRTSAVLTKIIFREFLGFEPEWHESPPDIGAMMAASDAALIIGDPALRLSANNAYRTYDLAELWKAHTGLGFVFAMWMTLDVGCSIDLVGARDEGLSHVPDIATNYASDIRLTREEMITYLTENISYAVDHEMRSGMELYFELAAKHELITANRPLEFADLH